MKWFIGSVLKWRFPSPWKATDIGTITHAVLEILANAKLSKQQGKGRYEDQDIGVITFSKLFDEKYLDGIINKVYEHYIPKFPKHEWEPSDLTTIKKYIDTCLTLQNGSFNPLTKNIIGSEIEFNETINEDWASYRYEFDNQILEGKLALRGFIDLVSRVDDETIEILDYKGLPIDTPIPTPSGWTTMGELQVGDIVFDENGNKTKILEKSKQKKKKCYRITFDDTSEVICDNEHLWKLSDGSIVDAPNLKIRDNINIAEPIDCKKVDLPIDPYVLGLWLGDGRNRCGEICGADRFVFNEIERRGYKLGDDISCKEHCPSHTIFGLTTELRKLNLLHNKHIPIIYLRASYEQRLDLLRGLMDSDGSVNSIRKQAVFTNCHKPLSDCVKELLLSLGQRPLQSHVLAHGFGLEVNNYPISFKPININPFLLPRKADRVLKSWGKGNSFRRKIVKIELLDEELVTQCIKVDSPSSTYLCTKNMIPTHNTGNLKDFNTGKVKEYEDFVDDIQLRMYHYVATLLYPDIPHVMVTIFYLKVGKPFTISYDRGDIPKTLDMIKTKFERVKNAQKPEKTVSFKCRKFCEFGMNTFEGTEIPVLRSNKKTHCCQEGESHKICSQVDYIMQHRSMDSVIKNMSKPSSSLLNIEEKEFDK